MSNKFLIRGATENDVDSVTEMRLRLQEHLFASNSKIWEMSKERIANLPVFYTNALKDQQCHLVVAEEKVSGVIIGVGLGTIQKHEEHIPNMSGKIDDIWVEPNYRKMGICKKIVSEIVAFFESKGRRYVIVLNYVTGNSVAEAVWKHLGFHSVLTTATVKRMNVKLQ